MTDVRAALNEATRRLIRTVDGLRDDDLGAPSLLPGWTRAHVVAHVALNAEALGGVLRRAVDGETAAMYTSTEDRDRDIEALAAAGSSALRDRFLASCTHVQEAVDREPDSGWRGSFGRVPGAPGLPTTAVPGMRRREVEVHHVDLGSAYGPDDWPEDFLDETFNLVVGDRDGEVSMRLRTPDGDVLLGTGEGPLVTGSRADLTYWLLGRGGGAGLVGDPELPRLGPWR